MTSRYFTADLHVGDPNVIKYRKQFSTLKEHDDFIFDELLTKLTKKDVLTVVGDGFISLESLWRLKKLPFRKELVLGNHCLEKGVKFRDLVNVFSRVEGMFHWKGYTVSHGPLHPDHLRGRRCIHGHLHEVIVKDPRFINVSLEAADYKLIHHDDILKGRYRTYRLPE